MFTRGREQYLDEVEEIHYENCADRVFHGLNVRYLHDDFHGRDDHRDEHRDDLRGFHLEDALPG